MKLTALITGASNGIGLELAHVHAANKGNLVLVARSREKLESLQMELVNKYETNVYVIVIDLAEPDSPQAVYDEIKKQGIIVDYLINNAGLGDYGFFHESDWLKTEMMINLNIKTLTHLTRLYLPEMITRRSGKIMNVASIAAFQPGPLMAVYFATKHYVLSFSEAIANEVQGTGVTVTALCPGLTESGFIEVSNMGQSQLAKLKKWPTSLEVAEYGYKAMVSGKTVAIHGWLNKIGATSVRFFPRTLITRIVRSLQRKA